MIDPGTPTVRHAARAEALALVPRSRREAIRRRLLAWWDGGHRELPWRQAQGGADPYRVWVSEVMLQQTRVAVVIPYYARFVERFPTLEALAAATEEEVLELWSGLGYYARGRRLHAAAREAMAAHGGLPRSLDGLLSLPGFGRYTAGAVASIAFAVPAPCVDGNAARVLSRLFLAGGRGAAATRRLWALAAELVPPARPGDFNQAVMELGATVCSPAAPRCGRCPLRPLCSARGRGAPMEVPSPRRRRPPPRLDVACAIVRRGDSLLLARRQGGGLFGGLWELPGAEVPPGADPRAELRRRLASSLGLRVVPRREVAALERELTHRRLHLAAYECGEGALPPGAGPALPLRFARPREWGTLAMSTAMRRLLAAVEAPGGRAGERPRGGSALPAARSEKPLLTRGGAPV